MFSHHDKLRSWVAELELVETAQPAGGQLKVWAGQRYRMGGGSGARSVSLENNEILSVHDLPDSFTFNVPEYHSEEPARRFMSLLENF